ncbi:YkvA family protein [Fulvivirga sedimenti]|jgi:uncharacterized membrane protein YkvA (DUF1232 family)|uniref:DUF1232 domain-containing protein n=1 Tax=Fulvivirga sedimenti TaxID=2879465 RepID=A0A9X1L092_9BACT|nr:DUF1232 domain-containing protein [Fulvivirga sedimenti]MCA6079250.1 DUF1232 domain-containing protein [Fulvivirga sedimenti]
MKEIDEETDRSKSSKLLSKVLDSRVFALAMGIAEKISYSKGRVYRLLEHAFEKLKEESNKNSIQYDFLLKVSTMGRMLKAYYRGDYKKVPSGAIMRIVGGLVYFVWILDVIPDFVPILGFADDVAVVIWIYNGLSQELDEFEAWESARAYNLDMEPHKANGSHAVNELSKTTK